MNCPKCNEPGCSKVTDEVDIGVGIQVRVLGYECPNCGNIAVCDECGALDFQTHLRYCSQYDNTRHH